MAIATILKVPKLFQIQVDDTAGTATYQTYDTTTKAWVIQWTLSLANGNVTVAENESVSGTLGVTGDVKFGGTASITGETTVGGTLGVTGDTTLGSTLATKGSISDNEALHSQAGATAGTIYWSAPAQGTSWKVVSVYLDGYENDTTTADTVTFPTAFTYTPYMDNVVGVKDATVSTTALSLDPDNTTTYTGWVFIYGY